MGDFIYFVAQIVFCLAIGNSFHWLLCPFDMCVVCVYVCVCVFLVPFYFLAL